MKNFKEYLAESEHVYDYRIRIVGEVSSEFIKELEGKLSQFDVVKATKPKTTPVQKTPAGFPSHQNDSVTIMDVSFRYPAIEPQIKQIAQLLGLDPNRIIMQTAAYDDSISKEAQDIAAQNKDLLTDTDYPEPDDKQKALNKDYSANPYDHAVLKNEYKSTFTVAGGRTPPAETTNDLPMGNTSPMSKMKRQALPATGRNPRG